MTSRATTLLTLVNALICGFVLLRVFIFPVPRTLRSDVIQGVLVGFALAFVSAQVYARLKATQVNGWVTLIGAGRPTNGPLMQAACAQIYPGPVNVPEEALYWKTAVDGAGRALDGRHDYVMHFPPGQLPPGHAFWSLTMGDAHNRFVPNPLNRYSVGDRTGLVPNADGSVDIYLQHAARTDHAANWLPAPAGPFSLWLRVYVPEAAIVSGAYAVPPVMRVTA